MPVHESPQSGRGLMDAFDSDVLIYAAVREDPLGRAVAALFSSAAPEEQVGVGSVLLLPEVLSKPIRVGATREQRRLGELLSRLELLPCDQEVAELAAELGAEHRLRAADAVHLATAVQAGADRFLTNNQQDFPQSLDVIEVVYPQDLAAS